MTIDADKCALTSTGLAIALPLATSCRSNLIRAHTTEGRGRAKARGVKMGRKPKLTPRQQREAQERL